MIKALAVSTWTHNGYLSMCKYAPSTQSARRGGVEMPLTFKLNESAFHPPYITALWYDVISWKRDPQSNVDHKYGA